jgi:hypothetical protein
MPDVWDLADMHADEITRLFAVRGAEWAEPAQPAYAWRRPVGAVRGGSDGVIIRPRGSGYGKLQGLTSTPSSTTTVDATPLASTGATVGDLHG